jgi:DNA topoisomerase-2
MASIGLKMGEEPKDIRFGKIFIYSDADPDGDSIAGLLINFFGKYWPELFERGVVCRVMTPLVVCKKGNDKKWFYTNKEFEDWEGTQKTLSGWSIEYKKGLAALENEEYKEIIQNPNYFVLDKGRDFQGILETWFAGDSAPRKMKILGEEEDEPVEEIETPQPIKPEKEKKSKAIF